MILWEGGFVSSYFGRKEAADDIDRSAPTV
jgi:hypothetical protein